MGAIVGFVVGTTATFVLLNSGLGSTAPCNHGANQDAIGSGECLGLYLVGGLGFGVLGALIGVLIPRRPKQNAAVSRLRVGLALQSGSEFGLGIEVAF